MRFPLRASPTHSTRATPAPPVGSPAHRTRPSQRATQAPKMGCAFCDAVTSAVVRSRASITKDEVHRRRQCAGCGKRFPTAERIDWPLVWKECPSRRPTSAPTGGRPRKDAPPPVTLEDLEVAIRRVWNQSISRIYSERDWRALEGLVNALIWHRPGATRRRPVTTPRRRRKPRARGTKVDWPALWRRHPDLRVALFAALKEHQPAAGRAHLR